MKIKEIRFLIGAYNIVIRKTKRGSYIFSSTKITLGQLKDFDDYEVLKICPIDSNTVEIYINEEESYKPDSYIATVY